MESTSEEAANEKLVSNPVTFPTCCALPDPPTVATTKAKCKQTRLGREIGVVFTCI
jgi:hypothetical protein